MAAISLLVRVFIASASDVNEERRIASEAVHELNRQTLQDGIILTPFRWETASPGYGNPQGILNEQLRESELVVVLFGGRVGKGTEIELKLASSLAEVGRIDNVFIYFRKDKTNTQQTPSEVADLKNRIAAEETALFCEYETTEDFEKRLQEHLQQWVRSWRRVPPIAEFTFKNSPNLRVPSSYLAEARLNTLRSIGNTALPVALETLLGRLAVTGYQVYGPNVVSRPLDLTAGGDPTVLDFTSRERRSKGSKEGAGGWNDEGLALPQIPAHAIVTDAGNGQVRFSDPEWCWYFCAVGLRNAIRNNDIKAVSRIPYINPVHQYLAALVREGNAEDRSTLIERLSNWLTGAEPGARTEPIARNFAAYVLGMIEARSAAGLLAEAIRTEKDEDVRRYSITSLGKLRSRLHLPLLIKLYDQEFDSDMRLLIGQAICKIVGLAQYEH